MITAEHEQPRAGDGEAFEDSVSLDFCAADGTLCGLVRISRLPNAGSAHGLAILVADGREVVNTQALDGIELETLSPLERWRVSLDGGAGVLKLVASAVSPPLRAETGSAAEVGVERYEQLCRLEGTLAVDGATHAVRCIGRRVHSWGAPDWSRFELLRSVYAASDSVRAVVVSAARPSGSEGHGEESRSGALVAEGEDPRAFEEVRISTVYGGDGLPAKSDLELFLPGEELPRRLGGEALHATAATAGEARHRLSFFRWSLEGVPAVGLYETAERR